MLFSISKHVFVSFCFIFYLFFYFEVSNSIFLSNTLIGRPQWKNMAICLFCAILAILLSNTYSAINNIIFSYFDFLYLFDISFFDKIKLTYFWRHLQTEGISKTVEISKKAFSIPLSEWLTQYSWKKLLFCLGLVL